MRLDRSKAYGKITPPLLEPEFDRPAYFEQNGKLFDAHERLIEPGQPLEEPEQDDGIGDDGLTDVPDVMPATQLLADADVMPWARFRAQAKAILGDTCPADKNSIKAALREAIAKVQERQGKRSGPQKSAGLTWDGITGKAGNGVNLVAWGQGQTEYLFGEVQKAIRTTYHKQIAERRDAVDFLIEQGVITAANARTDV